MRTSGRRPATPERGRTGPGRRCVRRPRAGRAALAAAALLVFAGCRREAAAPADFAAPEPPVEARAEVDRAVATTGDLITYRVTVERDPAYAFDLAEPGAEIAGFRIVDLGREQPRTANGRVIEERWYKLRADLVGSYVLPPVTVRYRPVEGTEGSPVDRDSGGGSAAAGSLLGSDTSGGGAAGSVLEPDASGGGAAGSRLDSDAAAGSFPRSLQTSEIFVEVESVLPADGTATDIRDIKPLERVRERPPWLLPAAIALALSAAAAAALGWFRRRRGVVAAPPRPAHEVAFAALDALRRTDFADLAAVRRYYFAISEVIRAYVEARFGLNATDLTSEEIRAALPRVGGLDPGEARRLTGFLAATDRVKFAARVPTAGEIGEVYEDALSFVEATRPAPEPAAAAPEAGGAPPAAPPSPTAPTPPTPPREPIAAAGGA